MSDIFQKLQQRLQYEFKNPKLLLLAVTHRSFSADHNERLEFLGDSVLNLSISNLLYQRLHDLPEGDLSRIRANLVRQETLHRLGLDLKLSLLLRLGEGEAKSGGHQRPSILADAFEAVLGAVFLDSGFDAAQALIHRLYSSVDLMSQTQAFGKDAKTELQEWLQARKMKPPVYQTLDATGVLHEQTFIVECMIPELNNLTARGSGLSRRAAEQSAAAAVFALLPSNIKMKKK